MDSVNQEHGVETVLAFTQALKNGATSISLKLKEAVSKDTGRQLAESLAKNSTVTSLYLWATTLNDAGMEGFGPGFARNRGVQNLMLSSNKIGPSGTVVLCQALSANHSLVKLSLRENPIGDEGAVAVATMLRSNRTIQDLELKNTWIGDQGTEALCSALSVNTSVRVLGLWKNRIGNAGAQHLSVMLKNNNTLISLDLDRNVIGDIGVAAIANSLLNNRTLTSLSLANNRFTDVGTAGLLSALEMNDAITSLEWYWNNTSDLAIQSSLHNLVANNRAKQQKMFADALEGDSKVEWRRSKLMLVGEGAAGKTSCVRSLLNQGFEENWESTVGVDIGEIIANSTGQWKHDPVESFAVASAASLVLQGITKDSSVGPKQQSLLENGNSDVKPTTLESEVEPVNVVFETPGINDEEPCTKWTTSMLLQATNQRIGIRMAIWDYGGQTVFYTLHHLFLSRYGVYLVVFDCRKLLNQPKEALQYITFWINSVNFHATDAPMLAVGTFCDQVESENDIATIDNHIRKVTNKFSTVVSNGRLSFFPVDNKTTTGVAVLRDTISSVSEGLAFVHTKVPLQWMRTLDDLLDYSSPWLSLSEVAAIAEVEGVHTREELLEMLSLLHQLGMLFYFQTTETLSKTVVTDPQWLVSKITLVIRSGELHTYENEQIENAKLEADVEDLFQHGLASRDLLEFLWDRTHVDFLLDLMRKLMLLSSWKFVEQETYLLPCMVTASPDSNTDFTIGRHTALFTFDFLPIGVFERLACLAVDYSSAFDDSESPVVRKDDVTLWFGADCEVDLRQREGTIYLSTRPESKARFCLDVVSAMLRKMSEEAMDAALVPQIHFRTIGAEQVDFAVAKQKQLKPWFGTQEENRTVENQTFTDFLASF